MNKQKVDKNIQSKNAPQQSLFGSFFKTFAKVKKPDEKFVDMKETIDKFSDNLNIVEKLYARIGKRQQELELNYTQFATSIRGLSALEENVDQPLRQFAEATEYYVDALKEMVKQGKKKNKKNLFYLTYLIFFTIRENKRTCSF